MNETETSNLPLFLPNILLPPLSLASPLPTPPHPPSFFFFSLYLAALYEGIRLSDGQKGWFPISNVIEITNEHVRRRNLRERYRVMRAASLVFKNNTIT